MVRVAGIGMRRMVSIAVASCGAQGQVEGAVSAIVKSAKTGKIGDGKVFVSGVEQAVRIRTDEKGESAI